MKTTRIVFVIFLFLILLVAFGFYSKRKGRLNFFREVQNTLISKNPRDICLTNEEYEEVGDSSTLVLSMPFDLKNYSTKHWGIVPFCAELKSGSTHGGLDFELKPNSKVFSATGGVVEYTQIGKEEGSGEIIYIIENGVMISYSGLTNLQVGGGDKVKRGEYIANTVLIPHGEHHVHLGVSIDGKEECPIKYMDKEFKDAFEQMFSQAYYESQADESCACACESFTPSWR